MEEKQSFADKLKSLREAGLTKEEALQVLLKETGSGPLDRNGLVRLIVSIGAAAGILGLVILYFGGDYILQLVLYIGLPLLAIMAVFRIVSWGLLPYIYNGEIVKEATDILRSLTKEEEPALS